MGKLEWEIPVIPDSLTGIGKTLEQRGGGGGVGAARNRVNVQRSATGSSSARHVKELSRGAGKAPVLIFALMILLLARFALLKGSKAFMIS